MVEPSRPKCLARYALLAFAAGCAAWLLRLDYTQKISTNVLDLIPAAEQAPEMGIIRGFTSGVQARVMLFALHNARTPDVPPLVAANAFAAGLRGSSGFAEVVVVGDPAAENALGREVFEHRLTWLLPTWLGRAQRDFAKAGEPPARFSPWLAARAAAEL